MKTLTEKEALAKRLITGSTVAFLFMIVMNFLANYLPLNGITTAEISDRYYNIFTPAGFTFIIWGVIYLSLALLLVALIWGVIRGRERPIEIVNNISSYFIASSVLNGIWIFTWHYELILSSLIVMLLLLLSLVLLYSGLKKSETDQGLYLLPFSIYLGWISVATIANVATFSVWIDWGGLGLVPGFWLTVLLLIIIGVNAFTVLRVNDTPYGLVILWALAGIATARWGEAGGVNYAFAITVTAAIVVFSTLVYGEVKTTS